MSDPNQILDLIYAEDRSYQKVAYGFVRRALEYTVKKVADSGEERASRHISGYELLEGIREFALEQYGPMTKTVLNGWGIYNCEDFGKIVFKMVEYKLLGKTEEDSLDDFKNGYDFYEAFEEPFLPNKGKE